MRNPNLHPGRECSPDCAEYGCASWTACDPDKAERAKAAERADRLTCLAPGSVAEPMCDDCGGGCKMRLGGSRYTSCA